MDKLFKWFDNLVWLFFVAYVWSYFMLDNKKNIWELVGLSATMALVNVLHSMWEDRRERLKKKK